VLNFREAAFVEWKAHLAVFTSPTGHGTDSACMTCRRPAPRRPALSRAKRLSTSSSPVPPSQIRPGLSVSGRRAIRPLPDGSTWKLPDVLRRMSPIGAEHYFHALQSRHQNRGVIRIVLLPTLAVDRCGSTQDINYRPGVCLASYRRLRLPDIPKDRYVDTGLSVSL
jgi:hypothetical protein